jgi:hypothetical protein
MRGCSCTACAGTASACVRGRVRARVRAWVLWAKGLGAGRVPRRRAAWFGAHPPLTLPGVRAHTPTPHPRNTHLHWKLSSRFFCMNFSPLFTMAAGMPSSAKSTTARPNLSNCCSGRMGARRGGRESRQPGAAATADVGGARTLPQAGPGAPPPHTHTAPPTHPHTTNTQTRTRLVSALPQ